MTSTVAIIDYGSGNLHSAAKAFERAAREADLGTAITVTSDPEAVRKADRIVLPGVGAFADCKAGLAAVPGMIGALEDAVRRDGKPFLGICVGMQLMASRGLEHETTPGLGWIDGDVAVITPEDPSLKIPHMGWNTLDVKQPHPLLAGVEPGLHAYYVHSYAMQPKHAEATVATTGHGGPVVAIVARDNLAGVQFHPEKSQKLGLKLIANFLRWAP